MVWKLNEAEIWGHRSGERRSWQPRVVNDGCASVVRHTDLTAAQEVSGQAGGNGRKSATVPAAGLPILRMRDWTGAHAAGARDLLNRSE